MFKYLLIISLGVGALSVGHADPKLSEPTDQDEAVKTGTPCPPHYRELSDMEVETGNELKAGGGTKGRVTKVKDDPFADCVIF